MDALYTKTFDLGIIGGGICGAAIARDATLRGISVALFEKDEFGSGTSGKSSKLIHGGIRYLELAWKSFCRGNLKEGWKNFSFVFVSLKESRILRRIAPSLVEPLPLVVPIYKTDKRKPWMIYSGAVLYCLMALPSGGVRIPTIYPGKKSALRALPQLNPEGLLGAVKIWDHHVNDRALVEATVRSAKKNGAICIEKTLVSRYEHEISSNTFLMHLSDHSTVRVRKLINASGPWIDKTKKISEEKEKNYLFPVAGAHITLNAFLPCSTLLQAEDGRFFFVIHHDGKARVGTTERVVADVDSVKPSDEEIDYLLSSLKRYFPGTPLGRKDILSSDAGVRPLAAPESSRDPNEIPREHEIRVSRSGCIHVIGVKLTDHRRAAEKVVDRLVPSFLPVHSEIRRKTLTHKTPL